MSASSPRYLKRALFWLVTTTIVYLLMNGAQIFETAVIAFSVTCVTERSAFISRVRHAQRAERP